MCRAAKAKSQDREQHGQTFSASRFSTTSAECSSAVPAAGMSEAFPPDPRTRAAPAKLVIGPVGAHGDAERQKRSGRERPGPDPRAQAASILPSIKRGGEGEGDGEADIAKIEERRMHGEADVLQDRVEIAASAGGISRRAKGFDVARIKRRRPRRWRLRPRVRGRAGAPAGFRRTQPPARRRSRAPRPQEHGALVVAPDASDSVEQRHRGMRMRLHKRHRKIGLHIDGD